MKRTSSPGLELEPRFGSAERAWRWGRPIEAFWAAIHTVSDDPATSRWAPPVSPALEAMLTHQPPQLQGVMRGHGTLAASIVTQLERSGRLVRDDGRGSHHAVPALAALGRLLHAPSDQIGSAYFPVACAAEGLGAIRRLHVGWRKEFAHKSLVRLENVPALDFIDAVSSGLRCAASMMGAEIPGQRDELSWWVEPDLPTNESIRGGSVAFAALVAWASWLLRLPVPSHIAFTGCLREEPHRYRLGPVCDSTLRAKIEASSRFGSITHMVVFKGQDDTCPDRLDRLEPVSSPTQLLLTAFPGADRERLVALGRRSGDAVEPANVLRGKDLELTRVVALLAAQSAPSTPERIADAIRQSDVWEPPADPAVVVPTILDELVRAGVVRKAGGVLELVRSRPEAGQIAKAQRHMGQAHFALERSWSERPEKSGYHAMAGGLQLPGPQRASAVQRAAQHLAEAARRATGLEAADDGVPRLRDALLAWEQSLQRAEFHTGADSSSAVTRVIDALGDSPHERLVALAWFGAERSHSDDRRLPWGLSNIAALLWQHHTWRDRLLTLQALIEASFHLLAAVSLALPGVASSGRAQKHQERPSAGNLIQLSRDLMRRRKSPPSQLGTLDEQRYRRLLEQLSSTPDLVAFFAPKPRGRCARELEARVNRAFHGPEGFNMLVGPDAECTAEERFGAIAGEALPFVRGLREALRRWNLRQARSPLCEDEPSGLLGSAGTCLAFDSTDSDGSPVEGPQLARLLDLGSELVIEKTEERARLWFKRGVVGPWARYWTYDDAGVRYLDKNGIDRELPGQPSEQTAAPELRTLPQPLVVLEINRAKVSGTSSPEMVLLERTVQLDNALGVLLRLCWFPSLLALPGGADRAVFSHQRNWLVRMNHRNLRTELEERARDTQLTPSCWLFEDDNPELLWRIIGLSERLNHAPGPCRDWAAPVTELEDAWRALLSRSPFANGALRLVGRDGRGEFFDCTGPKISKSRDASWLSAISELPSSQLALIEESGRCWPLGSTASLRGGRVWLLRELPSARSPSSTEVEAGVACPVRGEARLYSYRPGHPTPSFSTCEL